LFRKQKKPKGARFFKEAHIWAARGAFAPVSYATAGGMGSTNGKTSTSGAGRMVQEIWAGGRASGAGGIAILSRSNLPQVANDSPLLQPRSVGPAGAKPRRWSPLTRDTRKGIKRV